MPEKQKKKVWTPEHVAEKAHCAKQTIYRQMTQENSKFPNAWRLGRKWFIPHEDVVAYFGFDPMEVDFEVMESTEKVTKS